MATGTVGLHRVLRAPPERAYRAFLDADALVKGMPPNGFTGKVHHLEAKAGGTDKMLSTNLGAGAGHSFGGEYLELVPDERIRHTDRFDEPNLAGTLLVTVSFKQVSCGTELNIVQEGIPEVAPLEACYLGWQESLALLARLVEAELPGQQNVPSSPSDATRAVWRPLDGAANRSSVARSSRPLRTRLACASPHRAPAWFRSPNACHDALNTLRSNSDAILERADK